MEVSRVGEAIFFFWKLEKVWFEFSDMLNHIKILKTHLWETYEYFRKEPHRKSSSAQMPKSPEVMDYSTIPSSVTFMSVSGDFGCDMARQHQTVPFP